MLEQKKTVNTIKFNRVNGWTYKTSDNQFLVYNGGPNEWYSAPIDLDLVAKFGFCSVAIQESNKVFHNSLRSAQDWVRSFDYKAGGHMTDNPYPHRWAYCDATCSKCSVVDRVTVCFCKDTYTCYDCKKGA